MNNNSPGSLIQLHFHENFDVIDKLSDVGGILYYKDTPVFPSVSKKDNNAVTLETDGLYVSNVTMLSQKQYDLLSKFDYINNVLVFNDVTVSQEYTKTQITVMIHELWLEIDPEYDGGDEDNTGGDTSDPAKP